MSGQFDWGAVSLKLFEASGKKTLHISELEALAADLGIIPAGTSSEQFAGNLSGYLLRNSKSKAPQFNRVKNGSGGYRRGVYRLRKQEPLRVEVAQPKVGTGYTGAAGEYAVLSELLFRGFNASKMTVDDGIDVVASKKESYFHIQVKTANEAGGKYQASVGANAFQHSATVFYVVVLRTYTNVRYVNDYVIFSSGEIRRMVAQGVLGSGASISLRISKDGPKYLLNGKIDVTHNINDWDGIR